MLPPGAGGKLFVFAFCWIFVKFRKRNIEQGQEWASDPNTWGNPGCEESIIVECGDMCKPFRSTALHARL